MIRSTLAAAAVCAVIAGCGTVSSPESLRAQPPRLATTISEPLGPAYRRMVGLARQCFTRSGWLLDSAGEGVHADFFDSEGFAELSAQTSTPTWNLTSWTLRLDRSTPTTTKATLWTWGTHNAELSGARHFARPLE